MGRYTVDPPGAQHIGDADGLIALWLNERSAHDLAAMFRSPDTAITEILEAIERAYPPADIPRRTRNDRTTEGVVEASPRALRERLRRQVRGAR